MVFIVLEEGTTVAVPVGEGPSTKGVIVVRIS